MTSSFTHNTPRGLTSTSSGNPSEGSLFDGAAAAADDDHPDDEGRHPVPPSVHRQFGRPLQPPYPSSSNHQHHQQRQHQHHHHQNHQRAIAATSLASKPHAFGGAVLSPDHARNLSPDLVLQLTSALSAQASHAAASRGILPPGGERINIFHGSGLADRLLLPSDFGPSAPTAEGGGGAASTTSSSSAPATPETNRQQQHLPAHILQLLRNGGGGVGSATSSSFAGVPQTPKTSSSPGYAPTPGGASPVGLPIDQPFQSSANPLSLLSTAEALESFASWRTHYTVWITEAWNILKWSEPSAALFWEMATMFHTLYVASLSARGGGSGGSLREQILGDVGDAAAGPFGAVARSASSLHAGASSSSSSSSSAAPSSSASANTTSDCIPPLFSCNSQSSMGSVRSAAADPSSGSDGRNRDHHGHPNTPSRSGGGGGGGGGGGMKPARHSARELPVWLISMFLLVHCENEAFLRCTSGDDDRRFADHAENPGGASDGDPTLDFALFHNRSLSPRTRLHASSPGMHQNNANCAAFLLRHLRKFVLLCAVPRHALACRALATLAAKGGGGGGGGDGGRPNRNAVNNLDIATILQQHQREHGTIGLNVELTVEELDRLHLVLQAPSGGLVDEPPIAIGEHILKCLALEELEAHLKSKSSLTSPTTIRWHLMQNGLVTVSDAERVLRRYLEEELTKENQSAAMSSSEDVTSRLSKMSMGVSPIQPASPSRSQGVSLTSDSANTAKDGSSYLKELSYQYLRSTTVLLEPGDNNTPGGGGSFSGNNDGTNGSVTPADQHSQASLTTAKQGNFMAAATHHQPLSKSLPSLSSNESGRLHDIHVADCSDTHFYLLQPFEHATIAACTDCTIVLGAVAGLLHVVDCERTIITSAARRVVVSNSCDVVHNVFTPSPPLLVGDNRGCQFAPYNTFYEGLREDLLQTGLAALLRSASSGGSVGGSVAGDSAASPGRGGEAGVRCMSPTALPTLQCASNKWNVPVELCKLEVPPLPNVQTPGSSALDSSGSSLSPGADDRATVDVSMKTPILLPSSEFDVLLVPVESEEAPMRRQQFRESQAEAAAAAASGGTTNEEEDSQAAAEDTGGESMTVASSLSGITSEREKGGGERLSSPIESEYCRMLADLLTLSPFHMPHDYERRVVAKAERMRTLQAAMQELNSDQRATLEEEINRGFQDWLVTSGNFKQVLDLIHLEK